MKTTPRPLKHSTNSLRCRLVLFLVPLTLIYFARSPQAQATCHEGCGLGDNGNTFLGDDALINDTGTFNTAIGQLALQNMDSTATGNTAVGAQALARDTSGLLNTAVGGSALGTNTTGSGNIAVGSIALAYNTTGSGNTAIGDEALLYNTTGYGNTAIGGAALSNSRTGSSNIAVGAGAGAVLITGSNNIDIGNGGVDRDFNKIRIGTEGTHTTTYIAGIRGAPLVDGTALAVGITADGQLGVRASSARFKEAIKSMDKASEALLAMRPVTFRYKKDFDPEGIPQFGLVAEDVEKVNPDLVARDEQDKPYTVRYDAVNAMLLNEFLKEHRAFVEEQRKVQALEANGARLEKQIEALTATVQKVSAQLELSKAAPQTVMSER